MGSTVGIHLVWTTYGTWLPGDPSKPGHWSPLFDLYGRLMRAGHRINLPDTTTYAYARSLMNEPPKVLTADERRSVANVIGFHIAPALAGVIAPAGANTPTARNRPGIMDPVNGGQWMALANPDNGSASTPAKAGAMCSVTATGGARRDIVRAYACAIEPTHVHLLVGPVREDIARFAGRLKGTTSSALLKHSANRGRGRTWTAGFWKVFLFDAEALAAAQNYIERHNLRAGKPASPFEWLTPQC